MSKKYSLYVNNDNLYGCSGTYKVMDGQGNTLVAETALTLDSNGKTKLAEQTVADTTIAYWGGTRFTFTSIGAPTSVSGEVSRNDYHYYDLTCAPITYYMSTNFSMSFALALAEISGQTVTYPKTFDIATNKDFTNKETITFASAGTQALHYTESNFGGDKGSGNIYIKDTSNNAIYIFVNTLKSFNPPTLTYVSASESSSVYSVIMKVTNTNDIACNVWAYNDSDTPTDMGSISASSNKDITLTSSSTSGVVTTYLKLDNVKSINTTKTWSYSPTLSAIVVNSATMTTTSTLRVRWTNPNAIECSGEVYGQAGAVHTTQTFGASASGYTDIGVANYASSAFVGSVSAAGYNASGNSNSKDYSAYSTPTYVISFECISNGTMIDEFPRTYDEGANVDCTAVGINHTISGYSFTSASPSSYSNLSASQTCTLTYTAETQTLTAINITSAVMTNSTTLLVRWSNPNAVSCTGLVYGQAGAVNTSQTFGANATGSTTLTVANYASSAFIGSVSASGYNSSVNSSSVDYSAYTAKNLYLEGSNSVSVGGSITLTVHDGEGASVSNCTWTSSDTSKATVSSGVVTGVASGSTTITVSKDGYTSGTKTITVS